MFYIKEPSTLKKPWVLSAWNDEVPVSIPLEVSKLMQNYQLLPVEFLYGNYKKGLKGSILNEEEGMNFPLQVSAFLRAVIKEPSVVLIVCPDQLICPWHYHLTNHGDLKIIRVTSSNCQENFSTLGDRVALILSFSCLQLAAEIAEHNDFFSVIFDRFDMVASKMVFRTLSGVFNIGLTHKNFYAEPDQKLQWKMVNWSNPGCVGKLSHFCEVDNENVETLRDNYRFWWFRLTWQFCESFKRPTDEELEEYNLCLKEWGKHHHLKSSSTVEKQKRKRKIPEATDNNSPKKPKKEPVTEEVLTESKMAQKKSSREAKNINSSTQGSAQSEVNKAISCRKAITRNAPKEVSLIEIKNYNTCKMAGPTQTDDYSIDYDTASDSSSDTIILEQTQVPNDKYVELPSMDENPILTSIVRNLKSSSGPFDPPYSYHYHLSEPHCSNREDNVILSIFDNKKSQLPCTSTKGAQSQSEEFIISLVRNAQPVEETKESNLNDEIEQVLKEADMLLQN